MRTTLDNKDGGLRGVALPVSRRYGRRGCILAAKTTRRGNAMGGYDAVHGNKDDERPTTIQLGNYAVVREVPILHDMASDYMRSNCARGGNKHN